MPPLPMVAARLASAREALVHVSADARDSWLKIGMAIHNELPDASGFELWTQWSQRSAKFDARDQLRVWRSFKSRGLSGVGLNTVFAMAQGAGWRNTGNVAQISSAIAPSVELLLNLQQLDARSQAVRWAVKGLVPEASMGMIFGASGTFKSFVALDYCLHRAWSLPWCGRKARPGTPVFLAAEGGAGLMMRVKAWHLQHDLDWRDCSLRVVIVPLLMATQAPALAASIKALGVPVSDVVIDTMSQTYVGNENAADEVAAYFRAIATALVAELGCTVIVVHHSGHGATERPRGSSAILANVDFLFGVFREDEKSLVTTMECLKQKDGEKFAPMDFALTSHALGTDEDGDAITSLAAGYVNHAETLVAATSGKRDGHRGLLLDLVPTHGIDERELRKAFYAALRDAGLSDESLRKTYQRSCAWAVDNSLVRRSNGWFYAQEQGGCDVPV